MKKFWLSLMCVALVAAMVLSSFACKKEKEESSQPESESQTESEQESEKDPNTNPWVVDAVDSKESWIGTSPSLNTTDAKYGSAWLSSSSRDDQGSAVFSRTFDDALDLRGYANGYLHMYIYIENVSNLTGGQIELSSSGSADKYELSWDLTLYVTKSGWNEVNLPFETGNLVGGEIDLKNVNYMRVFMILSEDTNVGIDMVEFTNVEPEEQSHLDESGNYVFDEIETKGAWDGTNPRLITENAPAGNAYIYTDEVPGDALVLCRALENYDVAGFTTGYLRLWVYVQDITKVTGGQIELSSAGTSDIDEVSWNLLNYVTKSGWSEIYLPLSRANEEGGEMDYTAINYMRVYALTTEPNALGLDYICLTNTAPVEPSRIDKYNQFVLDEVNGLESWDGTSVKVGANGRWTGNPWIFTLTRNPDDNALVMTRTFNGLDAKAYKNGYLHLYIYVDDASAITGGQIELSSDTADVEETSWGLGAFTLKDGWNDVYLSIKDADKVGGTTDFSNLTYFRIYLFSSKVQTVGVDYISLSLKAPAKESPIDANGNYVIDNISAVAPWVGDTTLVYNKTNGFADGAGWISTSTSSQRDLVFCRNYAEADLSSYKYLHMWVYVSDLSALTGGMIEITSSGASDEEELYWPIASYLKQDGWNELYLPIADAMRQGLTNADLTKMDYIRVVAMVNSKGANVGIDMVYATNTEPQKQQEEQSTTIVIDKCESLDKWTGTGLTLVTNSAPEGSAFIKTGSDACPVAVASIIPSIDMEHLSASGYLHLNLYVEDVSNISYGQIELTSSGASDVNEVSWNVRDLSLTNGWNELYLSFADANNEGGVPNYKALNYTRIYVGFTEAAYFAYDDMYITDTAPATRIAINSMDDATGFAGDSLTVETTGQFEGTGYVKSGSVACPVICSVINPVDISELSNGYLHAYIYVSNADISYGQLEITSGGAADTNELSWDITTLSLKAGWNEVYLALTDADEVGGTIDFTAVNYFRLYVGFTSEGSIALDDLSVTKAKGGDSIAYALAVQEAEERSILNRGSVNMRSAIKKVLDKLANGEQVIASVFGPSTAAGAGASSGKGYADLFFNYLEGLDGDSTNGNLTRVNYSIGSTEGVYTVTRAEKDLLDYNPEFVVVNISRNDYNLAYAVEAYEGLFTKLYNAGIPCICLTTCGEDGLTMEKDAVTMCKQYGIPMISFPTAYHDFAHATEIVGLTNEEVWSGDHVHPSNVGHALIADLLISYCDSLSSETAADFDNTLPQKVTRNGFADSKLIENFNTTSQGMTVTMNGWTADYSARIYQLSNEGWQTSTVGSSISFTFTGGYFYFMFALSNNSGNLQINVDGVDTEQITWAQQSGETYMNVQHVLHNLSSGEHTVTLTLLDCDRTENDWFGICSVGYSNVAGTTEPEGIEFGVIDHVDENSSWGGANLNTDSYADGKYWVKGSATGSQDVVFYKNFADMDVNDYTEGYLHLWVYVDDIAKLRTYGGMIEISSANVVDEQELYWDLSTYVKASGWNELYLPMKSAQKQGQAQFNPNKLNTMRVVVMYNESGDCGISDIYFVTEKPFVSKITVNDFSTSSGCWGDGYECKDGAAYAKTANIGITDPQNYTGAICWKIYSDFVDASALENGYLHFNLYVEDASDMFYDWSRFKIGSGDCASATNFEYAINTTACVDGWNEFYVPVSDLTDNGADLTQLSWIWCYLYTNTQNAVFALKDVYFCASIPPERISLNTMDSATGMWGTGFEIVESAEAKEGTAYAKAISDSLVAPSICWAGSGIDISELAEIGYVHFWIYVEDASKVQTTSQVNIGDGTNYYKWNLSASKLNNGWNEVYLKMSDAQIIAKATLTAVDGTVDSSNICDIWIFVYFTEANQEYRVDDLSIVKTAPAEPDEPSEPATQIDVNKFDTNSGCWGDAYECKDSAAYAKSTNNGISDPQNYTGAICWKIYADMIDATQLSNGYLHFSFYVEDASDLFYDWSRFKIGSGDCCAATNLEYAINTTACVDGWNEFYVKVSDLTNNNSDMTQLSWIWCYIYSNTQNQVFALKDVYFCAEKPAEPVTQIDVNKFDTNSGCWGDGYNVKESAAFGTCTNGNDPTSPTAYSGAICWRIYSDFVDASALEDGYIHLSIYVEDITEVYTAFPGAFVIGEGEFITGNNLTFNLDSTDWVNGWNEVYLKVSSATDNNLDLTNISWIWYYNYTTVSGNELGIKDVYFCAEKPADPAPAVTKIVISNCDAFNGAYGDTMTVETTGMAEGTGCFQCIKNDVSGTAAFVIPFTATDFTDLANGYLHISVYVEDPSNVNNPWSAMNLGDGSTNMTWYVGPTNFKAGWNDLYFAMNNVSAGSADITKLSQVWFYLYLRDSASAVRIDDVYVCATKPEEATTVLLHDCEANGTVWGSGYELGTVGTFKGAGFFKAVLSKPESVYTGSICTNNTVDATGMNRLHVAVYVNDPTKLDINAVFQMGDGTNNIYWNIDITKLNAGWNEIVFKMEDGIKTAGDINMASVGNIFFYMNSNIEGLVYGLDDAYFYYEEVIPEPVTQVVVNNFTTGDGCWGDGYYFNNGVFAKATNGTGAYTGGLCWQINENFIDASALASGYLHVSVYVEDPSELQYDWSHFNIGNGACCATTKLEWSLTSANLVAGWNDVYFPISSALTNTADLTQISWIWFYTYTRSQNAVWGMKDVYFCAEVPEAEHVNIAMFDAAAGSYGDNYTIETTNTNQGAGYGLAHNGAAATSGAVVYDNASAAVDITGKAYIHVSFYIEDPSNILYDWGSFQLGDGTTALTWKMTADMFKTGWTEVYLPIASASGSTDVTKISKIWFYLYCRDASVGFGIDNVYATNDAPAANTVLYHACEANGTVWGSGYELGTTGTFRGAGFFKATTNVATAVADVYTGSICTNNVVDATDATKLHVAIYVSDPSKMYFNWNQLNIGDGTNNYQWILSADNFEAGWNELVLDLSTATKTAGDVNMAAIGNVFFYMNSNAQDLVFGLDDVYFIK